MISPLCAPAPVQAAPAPVTLSGAELRQPARGAVVAPPTPDSAGGVVGIAGTRGSYPPAGLPGGVRLTRRQADAGRTIPGLVRRWPATISIQDQLTEMQRRATVG